MVVLKENFVQFSHLQVQMYDPYPPKTNNLKINQPIVNPKENPKENDIFETPRIEMIQVYLRCSPELLQPRL